MSFQDQTLVCTDCKNNFVFSAGEQEFYQQRGFTNTPKRCEDCRSKKKAQAGRGSNAGRSSGSASRFSGPNKSKQKFPAVCSRCATSFDAPFQPKNDRPVFCRTCFEASKR